MGTILFHKFLKKGMVIKMRIAVLDIGGTFIKSALFCDGALTAHQETPTMAACGGASVLKNAIAILRTYLPFDAVGISSTGYVDKADGHIVYANDNMPGYTGTRLGECVAQAFGVPVAVEKDVNAMALGENQYGAAQGATEFLCVAYGTGVGGAIVTNGAVYHGGFGFAGGFGSMITHAEYACEGDAMAGSYERFASTTALVNAAQRYDAALTNGRIVFENMHRPQVTELVDAWIEEILQGIISLVYLCNPPLIVLGGGILSEQYVYRKLCDGLVQNTPRLFHSCHLVQAKLGNNAALWGAAWLARQKLETQ